MKYLDETGLKYFWNKIKAKMPTPLDSYPIGSIYMSINNINPSNLFGGTWVAWGSGRVPVGVDTSQTEFNTVEKTGGEKTHKLTVDEMPEHNHSVGRCKKAGTQTAFSTTNSGQYSYPNDVGDITIENTGGSQPHNNLQPYITCYMWKRTA